MLFSEKGDECFVTIIEFVQIVCLFFVCLRVLLLLVCVCVCMCMCVCVCVCVCVCISVLSGLSEFRMKKHCDQYGPALTYPS